MYVPKNVTAQYFFDNIDLISMEGTDAISDIQLTTPDQPSRGEPELAGYCEIVDEDHAFVVRIVDNPIRPEHFDVWLRLKDQPCCEAFCTAVKKSLLYSLDSNIEDAFLKYIRIEVKDDQI